MVTDELLVILPRLFHAEQEHNGLLGPVGGLEQVVELEDALGGLVRKVRVHAGSVEVPDRSPAHHVHAGRAQDAEVDGRVHLLHEAGLLTSRPQAGVYGKRPEELLHDELAGKGEDDNVEGHESEIPRPLAILNGSGRVGAGLAGELVGEEDEVVDGIGRGWVDGEQRQEDGQDDQGQGPGVLDGEVLAAAEKRAGLSTFGALLGYIFAVGRRLRRVAVAVKRGVFVQPRQARVQTRCASIAYPKLAT